jgi:glycosyltransferase involved in cell wall biosynthesis/O-antigen/teichoic acid export membrane protein
VSLVNFSSFFLLARTMPEAGLGEFAVAYTVIVVMTAFQQALLGNAYQVRAARLDGFRLKRFTTVVMAMQVALAGAGVLILLAAGGALMAFGYRSGGTLAMVLGLSVAPWLTQDLLRKVFYTRRRSSSALANDIICYGLQISGIVWLILRPEVPKAWMGVAVYGIASATAAVAGIFQIRNLLIPGFLRRMGSVRTIVREVWEHGRYLVSAQTWRQLGATGHTWIIAALLGPAALGSYRAAAHLLNILNPIQIATGLWLPSKASTEFGKGGAEGLQDWHRRVFWLLLSPLAILAVLIFFTAEPVLRIAYDGKFDGTGMHWVLAALAFSRVISFARDLFHNGLVAANRTDTALVDSYLTLGFTAVVGIPAVYFFGVYGVPISSLSVHIGTMVYNRRVFRSLTDVRPPDPRAWKPVGMGAEGRVFLDHERKTVTKVYGADVSADAAGAYYRALEAAAGRPDFDVASTPRPISFEPEVPMIQMESCPGISLSRFVESGKAGQDELLSLAGRVWIGMKSVPSATGVPSYDLWPDNLLYDAETGRLTFLDFVTNTRKVDASSSLGAHTLGGFVGHALYRLSRPSRWYRLAANQRTIAFCRLILRRALDDGESPEIIGRIARRVFESCTSTNQPLRRLYYRSWGQALYRAHARTVFRSLQIPSITSREPMIYHFVKDFPGHGVRTANGVHGAVRGLTAGLLLSGTPTEVLCGGPVRSSWMTLAGVDVHAFRNRAERFPGLKLPEGLKAHVNKLPKNALFVIHGQFSPEVSRVAIMLRRLGRPYVWMPHSVYNDDMFRRRPLVKWVYWNLIEKRVLQEAALIQLLGEDQAISLKPLGIGTPVAIVPNAVDPNLSVPEEKLAWTSKGPIRLFYLGRINIHQKALDLLVQAVGRIKDEFDIQLTIQGPDGGPLEELKRISADADADAVTTFLPPEFSLSPTSLMAQHDVYCMPSRIEGFPMAALEAMQAARPLLFSNISGLTEAVQDSGCGVLVSPTLEDVTRGLREICSRRAEFETMGRAGRAYVEKHFSRKEVGAIALRAYSAISRRRGARRDSAPAPDRARHQPQDSKKSPAILQR